MICGRQLNQRIVIQNKSASIDSYGESIETWSTYATIWAAKQHKTSREFYAAQKVNSEITDMFIIRFNSAITTLMRVSYNSKYYDIIGADDPDGGRRETHLLCKVVE